MKQVQKILFPIDFASHFESLVPWVETIAEKILELAKKEKIDMIIMGAHGRKGLDRAIFGSVADKVVASAPCPVLTIHP